MNEFIRKKNILIIAEGFEEKYYIDKLLSFPNIKKDIYSFAEVINAKSNTKISARYQYEIQRGFYDVILIFCDTDKGSKQFIDIVNEIGEKFFLDKDKGIEVFIFANPVTLQIVLSHFGEVYLTRVGKKSNAEIVERLTGIKDYDAKQEQIEEMVNKIYYRSMNILKENLNKISQNPKDIPSTNFLTFLNRFESDDTSWIDEIDKYRK